MNQNTFSIIQSLCRMALGGENPALRKQVERLRTQFHKEELFEQADALDKLLTAASRQSELQPSKVTIAPAFVGKEVLARGTSAPTDRETGASLAELIFPSQKDAEFPFLDAELLRASESIVEEWRYHEKLSKAGITPPTTCLIYGQPGTGKTCLALAIAAMLNLPVVLARLDGLISSFLGTTGRNIGNLFSFANRYQCLLLLDEFDAIAKVRDDPHEVGEIKRVVNAILQNIDQRRGNGFTIAITNHERLLDSAVWRRFDLRISIPAPAIEVRRLIAERYFAPHFQDDLSLDLLAWLSEGMTGADIEVMAQTVKRHQVLNQDSTLVDSLRHFSLTQAGRDNMHHQSFLSRSKDEMTAILGEIEYPKFSQKKIAELFGISQAKVSRTKKQQKR